ncbi:hypothetical protein E2320_006737 [Naja naja]|nr:hypothetical protein E2320_006737 [Naja naja]
MRSDTRRQQRTDPRCKDACHNHVLRCLEKMLRQTGVQTSVELMIPSRSSIKPDLIVETANQPRSMGVLAVLPTSHWAAVPVSTCFPLTSRCFQQRAVLLTVGALGLSCWDIMDMCLLTIGGSLKCYDLYMRGTKDWNG